MSVNDIRQSKTDVLFEVKQGEGSDTNTSNNCTFVFGNEDHTLGNSLRYILTQHPETEFCGYSVPHPYDPKMNVRLQTAEGSELTSLKLLQVGLKDLEETANTLERVFESALQKYSRSN